MQEFKGTYARDIYTGQLQTLIDDGEPVDVRGRKTVEILNAVTTIYEPQHHCILLPSRRWNPWIAMSEALWILAGRNDVATLKPYNSHISDYSDDGVVLYGAYGARIYDQIDPLIERLRKDPSDRRAVLQIWDNGLSGTKDTPFPYRYEDLTTISKDPPCNDMLFFKLRNNKLHMTVLCRSNDIHWGLYAVNIPTFGILQEYIAARLGVELGVQQHLSNSLHVYTDEQRAVEITDRMLYGKEEPLLIYPKHELAFMSYEMNSFKIKNHEEMAFMCSSVLEGEAIPKEWPDFLKFASDFLKLYKEKPWKDSRIGDWKLKPALVTSFADWIVSGQIFVGTILSEPVAT